MLTYLTMESSIFTDYIGLFDPDLLSGPREDVLQEHFPTDLDSFSMLPGYLPPRRSVLSVCGLRLRGREHFVVSGLRSGTLITRDSHHMCN